MSIKAAAPHTHGPGGHCETCGHAMKTEIECGYEVSDRRMQTLFVAVCQTMKLEPYRLGKKRLLFVTAPDQATHDALCERFDTLAAKMDQKLTALTADFIREHCGRDVKIPHVG
jgi:hypothetical protein